MDLQGPPLGDRVDPVRIELPVPFPLKTVNAWLFPGVRPVLLDCGIGGQEVYQALVHAIRGAGVDPHDLSLYLSHGHVDHAGNARRLRDDFGVPLICPREEAPFVETFRRDEGPRNDAFADALRAHGMPDDDVTRIRAQSDAIDAHLDDCPIDDDLPGGAELLFGDQTATALRTPGHTPGSTCYLLDEAIITGDTLLERITSNAVELKDDDKGAYHRYVQTVDGLRRYVGLEALPGHHAPFRLSDDILDRQLAQHADRRRRILRALHRPKTAWQLFPEIFPGLHRDNHYFMGMAEIVGHLHSLHIDGLVEQRPGTPRRFIAGSSRRDAGSL